MKLVTSPEKLTLRTYQGAEYVVQVLGAETMSRILHIRWGFKNYEYDVQRQMLKGSKLVWRAKDFPEAVALYERLVREGKPSAKLIWW